VPEGEHTLEMRFEPTADRYGTWIAWASTIFVYGGVLVLVGMRVRRRGDENAGDEDEGNAS
jgi:hypothetical protein